MFVKNNRLITYLSAALIILSAVFIPFFKNPLIDALGSSLAFFSSINREIQGIIFYHHNLVENQRLHSQVGLLRRQLHEVSELYLENVRLRQLLDFKEKSVYPLTAASVIGRDPSNLSSLVIIDKGRGQGIKPGCAVITNEGLVGRVIEAGASASKVLVINDINSGVAAVIQRSRQGGLVCGTLGRDLTLQYLPPDADIVISDLAVTSGVGGVYPKGILIGKVVRVRQGQGRGEIFVLLQPAADLTRLEEVLVVLNP